MQYYFFEPEVAGQLGPRTVMDRGTHPPTVTELHYQFDDWLGDVIVECFPCFLITADAAAALIRARCTGFSTAVAEITMSQEFATLNPAKMLPPFVWLKVTGKPGVEDIGVTSDARLVVSERSLAVLRELGAASAHVAPHRVGI